LHRHHPVSARKARSRHPGQKTGQGPARRVHVARQVKCPGYYLPGQDMASAEAEILELERAALDRWGRGDPGGFLDLYGAEVGYFDPVTAARVDGHGAMVEYYQPFTGKIHITRYDILNPQVVVEGDLALLSYNLVNYAPDAAGVESVGSHWNST